MHGPGVDEPILWDEGSLMNCSATRFLHTNHQGSIIAVADCNGTRTAINSYDPFGIPSGLAGGSTPNTGRFGYTGQIWIPEVGMYYYKARFYSPLIGRFLQTDPIGYEDGLNWYAYVGGDPVNGRDPTGMFNFGCGSANENLDCKLSSNSFATNTEPVPGNQSANQRAASGSTSGSAGTGRSSGTSTADAIKLGVRVLNIIKNGVTGFACLLTSGGCGDGPRTPLYRAIDDR